MSTTRAELARKLRSYRAARGLNQEQLAPLVGVSGKTIGRWEREESDVEKDESAEWIIEHLKIDPPRPSRTAAAKVDLEERILLLEKIAASRSSDQEIEALRARLDRVLREG